MGTLVATAVVGGVATGVVLPSIGRFATAFTNTPTVPTVAFGILPAQVVLVTHQVMTRVFKDRNWEAKNQIHVYAICLIDLAAGVATTAIIATLTKTELPNGLAISFAGISAILIVLGLQSLSKKNDMLTENNELLQKLKINGNQISQSQEIPPPPPDSPKGQQITALRNDFESLTNDLGKTNSFTQQMGKFVNTSISSLNERFRRLRNKSENRDEEISTLTKELSKLKETVSSLQPEIDALKQKTADAANNARLARADIGRVEQRIGSQSKPEDAADLYQELPGSGWTKAFSGFSVFGSKASNSTTDAAVKK